jgi:hypothetical protein
LAGRCQAATAGIGFTIQNEALETIEEQGAMDPDQRTRLRLASTWSIQSLREVVNTLHHDCGSMSVFEEDPFERRLRDIHIVAQQDQGRILQLPGRPYSSLSAADVLRLIKQPSSSPR